MLKTHSAAQWVLFIFEHMLYYLHRDSLLVYSWWNTKFILCQVSSFVKGWIEESKSCVQVAVALMDRWVFTHHLLSVFFPSALKFAICTWFFVNTILCVKSSDAYANHIWPQVCWTRSTTQAWLIRNAWSRPHPFSSSTTGRKPAGRVCVC